MNWENILNEAVLGLIGIVISALGALVSYWIAKKAKDEKLKGILNSLHEVVRNAVLETYQTYVEELKDKDVFDKEAQKKALTRALNIIETNLSEEVKTWLKTNYGNVQEYLKGLIEAQIALLKK